MKHSSRYPLVLFTLLALNLSLTSPLQAQKTISPRPTTIFATAVPSLTPPVLATAIPQPTVSFGTAVPPVVVSPQVTVEAPDNQTNPYLLAIIAFLGLLCTIFGVKAADSVPLKFALTMALLFARMTPSPDDDKQIEDLAKRFGIKLDTPQPAESDTK